MNEAGRLGREDRPWPPPDIDWYYADDYVAIAHGDCRDVLPKLEAGIDLILTDLPYGVGKAEWDIAFPRDWIAAAWNVTRRMLVMPGNTALIEAGKTIGHYRDCIVLYSVNGMTLSRIAFGNWIPVLACGDWKWEARPNVLPFTISTRETIDHPSPKPIAAMLRLIQSYSKQKWMILDPFMGSGSTLVAAKQLGRKAIGIEISEEYCEIAAKRMAQVPMIFEQQGPEPEQLALVTEENA